MLSSCVSQISDWSRKIAIGVFKFYRQRASIEVFCYGSLFRFVFVIVLLIWLLFYCFFSVATSITVLWQFQILVWSLRKYHIKKKIFFSTVSVNNANLSSNILCVFNTIYVARNINSHIACRKWNCASHNYIQLCFEFLQFGETSIHLIQRYSLPFEASLTIETPNKMHYLALFERLLK